MMMTTMVITMTTMMRKTMIITNKVGVGVGVGSGI